jgi:hypothetical protein
MEVKISVTCKVILQTYLFESIERGVHKEQDSKIRPHFFLWFLHKSLR